VRLDEPTWWYGGGGDFRQRALVPLGRLYGWIAERRYSRHRPYRSRLPVICVGNFTAGGTGKTPLAIAIARLLIARGERPVFLTRGYGGRTAGPAWVAASPGAARLYGDEPLLLCAVAPTLVARDRRAGVIAIEADRRQPTVIVMDDGLQNGAVAKDLSLALVDGKRGVGNGEVIPAGPLRAPLDFQQHRFTKNKLRAAVADILVKRPGADAITVLEHIFWSLRQHAGLAVRADDQTVIVLRIERD
jgi:tetraacyldisaccharide 4'-kinase